MTCGEPGNWVDGTTLWLVRRAARRVPGELAARLEEEWSADLTQLSGELARLRFALGCFWATVVITRELLAQPIAAPSTVVVGRATLAGLEPDGASAHRTATFFLVVCLHLAVLYGFLIGLRPPPAGPAAPPPFVARIIEPAPTHVPPPPPNLARTRIEMPVPELPAAAAGPADEVFADPVSPSSAEQAPPVTPVVHRVPGGPGAGFPSTESYYPDASRRAGETGVATLKTCIGAAGQLTAEPTLVQSTGSTRLDDSALKLARAGSGHYRPTTENGVPVSSCYAFRIRFELNH